MWTKYSGLPHNKSEYFIFANQKNILSFQFVYLQVNIMQPSEDVFMKSLRTWAN